MIATIVGMITHPETWILPALKFPFTLSPPHPFTPSCMIQPPDHSCNRYPRRAFLADVGMGFTGLVLGAMLQRDGVARAAEAATAYRLPDGKPHLRRRRRV